MTQFAPLEIRMYRVLADVLEGAALLHEAERRAKLPIEAQGVRTPRTILDAYIIEIAFKLLVTLRGVQYERGHDLQRLFEELPGADKRCSIEIHQEQGVERGLQPENCDIYFYQALNFARNYFTNVRYIFERESRTKLGI